MIRSKEYCDICEKQLGQEHPDALIKAVKGRPAFPQLIWTYFRKGYQCLINPSTLEPTLGEAYFGIVNKMEFCEKHGREVNVILKAYSLADSRMRKTLDELLKDDVLYWREKNHEAEEKFETALETHMDSKTYQKMMQEKDDADGNGEHTQGADNNKDGGGSSD